MILSKSSVANKLTILFKEIEKLNMKITKLVQYLFYIAMHENQLIYHNFIYTFIIAKLTVPWAKLNRQS